jgi:hypothetical protein
MADFTAKNIEKLIAEGPIGMAETARHLGTFRGGRPCHPSTPTRWCVNGVRLPDGSVLRLEHYRTVGRLMTSKAALLRFLAAQQDGKEPVISLPVSPAERNRAAASAGRELDQLGI